MPRPWERGRSANRPYISQWWFTNPTIRCTKHGRTRRCAPTLVWNIPSHSDGNQGDNASISTNRVCNNPTSVGAGLAPAQFANANDWVYEKTASNYARYSFRETRVPARGTSTLSDCHRVRNNPYHSNGNQ
ncbi:hypothetical protein [Xanthocytophaga flava]|uniref:hypothetical protein n=1 Tax=Xanthocytophaga flava TaxID=3048013 RepID=UPI0028CFFFA6|nr:hypothetical protein [Xanthocytophaga flavus]MDJ1466971.1 hypothetical protein [Xanthocytophaga flavus]